MKVFLSLITKICWQSSYIIYFFIHVFCMLQVINTLTDVPYLFDVTACINIEFCSSPVMTVLINRSVCLSVCYELLEDC